MEVIFDLMSKDVVDVLNAKEGLDLKRCSKCHDWLQKWEFGGDKYKNDGLHVSCKECRNERLEELRKEEPERYRGYCKTYRDSEHGKKKMKEYNTREDRRDNRLKAFKKYHNSEKGKKTKREYNLSPEGRYSKQKGSAKQRGKEFKLTLEEFTSFQGQKCHYCDSELDAIRLDRVDSSKGYLMENVVQCCITCNFMKLEMTVEQFVEQAKRIVQKANRDQWNEKTSNKGVF